MNYQKVIQSQYLATLAMLKQAFEKCPDSLWNDPPTDGSGMSPIMPCSIPISTCTDRARLQALGQTP